MDKIYGYKQADLIGLSCLIKNAKDKKLTTVFDDYSAKSGKARGTVRNLYYALVKLSAEDKAFRDKYLGGKTLVATKITTFDKTQEDSLVKSVLDGVNKGKSVRKTVLDLADGDGKLALRYQNKFRNLLCKNPDLARKVKTSQVGVSEGALQREITISDALVNRLKKEIDGLVDRISLKEKKDNDFLRKRVAFLESENLKLSKLLYGGGIESQAIKFFTTPGGAHTIH